MLIVPPNFIICPDLPSSSSVAFCRFERQHETMPNSAVMAPFSAMFLGQLAVFGREWRADDDEYQHNVYPYEFSDTIHSAYTDAP